MRRGRPYKYIVDPKMKHALQCVTNGDSFQRAAFKTGLAPETIKKYFTLNTQSLTEPRSIEDKSTNDEVHKIFTPDQETSLKECLIHFESLFYGISEKECRMLAYQMVVREDLKIPDGWTNGMAATDWLQNFQYRHPDLKLAKPRRCSTCSSSRNITWEKLGVSKFYDNLEKIIHGFPTFNDGARIFSLDETYTAIDPIATLVRRKTKSDLLTTCCIVSANGTSLPPVFVKPYKNLYHDTYSDIPPGSIVLTASRGRMTLNLFPEVMQHFVKHSNSTPENPSILIMDIDLCHLSSAALDLAKTSGVHLLTLHPHINRLLQPLQTGLFKLFQECYYAGLDLWCSKLEANKINEMVRFDVGKIVSEAYAKTMTPENIQNAFKKCGILPYDRDLFTDSDYLSRIVGEHPCTECKARDDRGKKSAENNNPSQVTDENESENSNQSQVEVPEKTTSSAEEDPSQSPKRKETPQSDGIRRKVYTYENDPKMKLALQYVMNGDTFYKAACKTGIAHYKIKRYFNLYNQSLKEPHKYPIKILANDDVNQIFTRDQETSLKECLIHFESLFYGISEKECRMLAYQMVVREDLKIPDGWTNGMAATDWLQNFKYRHPDLKLAKPRRCSTFSSSRNITWDKIGVSKFYDNLEKIIHGFPTFNDGARIFSLDETYTAINMKATQLMCRETKSDLLTTCCIVSANGTSLPPVFVKPYKNLYDDTYFDIPPGSIVLTASRGRMTLNLFPDVMQHFVKHSNSTPENPSILIMDIDLCHLSSVALDLAKASGVHLLTLHPHINRLLQPLQASLFKLFHECYYAGLDLWWSKRKANKTKKMITFNLVKILSEAYAKTMTPENIQNAFKKCGILPYDRDLFTDSDYRSWKVGEQPCIECRARDDRSKKSDAKNKPIEVTNENLGENPNQPQVEVSEKTTSSAEEDPSQSSKRKKTPQRNG